MQPSRRQEPDEIRKLIHKLEQLHSDMLSLVSQNRSAIAEIRAEHRASAANLLHYLALRRHDIRELQGRLGALGLSSLGRTEANVLRAVQTVLRVLTNLNGRMPGAAPPADELAGGQEGRELLKRNTDLLLGPAPEHRTVRIMVTAPSEAASDCALFRDLLIGGMNCLRINCAHDDEAAWSRMIGNLRQAEQETGRRARIQMDVAGPKLRTGPIEPGPAVAKCRPGRDVYGRVVRPARIWLTSALQPEPPVAAADACIPVPEQWLTTLKPGDVIRLVDARGAKRSMTVHQTFARSCWAETAQTIYFTPDLQLRVANHASRGLQWREWEPSRPGHQRSS